MKMKYFMYLLFSLPVLTGLYLTGLGLDWVVNTPNLFGFSVNLFAPEMFAALFVVFVGIGLLGLFVSDYYVKE